MIRESVPSALKEQVMKRDKGKCRYCGSEAKEIDHITPYSRGGDNDEDNLVACCKVCNQMARAKLFDSFTEKRIYLLTRHCAGYGGHFMVGDARRQLRKLLRKSTTTGKLSRHFINLLTGL